MASGSVPMYAIAAHPPIYHQAAASSGAHFRSEDVLLNIRQQPKEALVTSEGKEKARKPVDPPPIIQLNMAPRIDPQQHFLQSPYLFMCTSLWKPDKDEAWDGTAGKSLSGSLVSSLHRLKDISNKDGGFFVFGDISVKVQGTFRLHFSLFDLHKDTNEVMYLGSVTSERFKVLLPKDFKGMDESTYLSRAFSDQGVRLRLRKEPRAMMGTKRTYPYGSLDGQTTTPIRPNMEGYYGEESGPNKRLRADTEDRKDSYADHTGSSGAGFAASYSSSPNYPVRQQSISGFNLSQYPSYTGLPTGTTSSSSPYQFRGNLATNTSSFYNEPLLPTTGTGGLTGSLGNPSRYPEMPSNYSNLYSSYPQQRNTASSGLSFSEDTTGLPSYRTSIGMGEDHRPTTASGISSILTQQTPQSGQTSHQSQDSLGSSRGGAYSQSPEVVRSGIFPDRLQVGPQLHAGRSTARIDDHTNLGSSLPVFPRTRAFHSTQDAPPMQTFQSSTERTSSNGDSLGSLPVYQQSRNAYLAPASEPNLTSNTDTGIAIPPSLPYNPGLSQPTDTHNVDVGDGR